MAVSGFTASLMFLAGALLAPGGWYFISSRRALRNQKTMHKDGAEDAGAEASIAQTRKKDLKNTLIEWSLKQRTSVLRDGTTKHTNANPLLNATSSLQTTADGPVQPGDDGGQFSEDSPPASNFSGLEDEESNFREACKFLFKKRVPNQPNKLLRRAAALAANKKIISAIDDDRILLAKYKFKRTPSQARKKLTEIVEGYIKSSPDVARCPEALMKVITDDDVDDETALLMMLWADTAFELSKQATTTKPSQQAVDSGV
eukprot:gnl/MRDRNA2_/MRDRNA2_126758_c0_seq1.p1 gnl/MRDRNA2_/MRDRNA2_126758_c0~~gnl/MRDRNA2_/MRDRNA2_126758_c0_seq1.p1  ORF type:complete len:259 (-),score=51.01 gnl/MRDRNA2_/MRDRNA2_126758_c0_seq1:41-817(-)